MTKLIDFKDAMATKRTFGFFDDFDSLTSGVRWTPYTTGATTPSTQCLVLATTGTGGVYSMTTDATTAKELYLGTTNATFLFQDSKPLIYEVVLTAAEANTNTNNVIAGFMSSGFTTGALQNAAAGPATTFSGAVFYKTAGSLLWSCRSQIGDQVGMTDSQSNSVSNVSGFQTLTIEITPTAGGIAQVVFSINGAQCVDQYYRPIIHQLAYANATNMYAGFGLKTGSGTGETVTADYCAAYALR